jgi:transcriptional regulator with XRE-family HTH domain
LGREDRYTALRTFLRDRRARISPRDAGLPVRPGRRLHGLSAEDVAELIGVSPRWYLRFESGQNDRRFSLQFVQRVAAVLQLDEDGSATLYRLALAEANAAAAYYERSASDGALHALSAIRHFSSRLGSAANYEEAVIAAVETVHSLLQPDCVTVANLIDADGIPMPIAIGPRVSLVTSTMVTSVLEMNNAVKSKSIVLCENAPKPSAGTDRFDHPVKIRSLNGSVVAGVHDPEAHNYCAFNSVLGERSQIAAGLFEGEAFRGNLVAFWREPRRHTDAEVDIVATACALLELAARPSWTRKVEAKASTSLER